MGGIMLGLETSVPLESLVQQLRDKGVRFTGDIVRDQGGSFANFEDPDGTPIYLWQQPIGSYAAIDRD